MYLPLRNKRTRTFSLVLLVLVSFLGAAVTVFEFINSFAVELSFRKDFFQEYLLASASFNGLNPYLALNDLAQVLFRSDVNNIVTFPHPSPHPPGILAIIFPLGALTYFDAQIAWGVLQFVSLIFICLFLAKQWNWQFFGTLLFFLLFLSSRPGYVEIVQGQLGILLALSVVVFLHSIFQKRCLVASFCLGFALAIKFFGAPVLLFLLIRKKWQLLIGSIFSFVLFQLLAIALVGVSPLKSYYFEVLPYISELYQFDIHNLSLLTLPYKLVEGSNEGVLLPITFLAPFAGNYLVYYLLWPLLFILAIFFVFSSIKINEVDAYLLLFAGQLLFSPIQWIHGYVVLIVLIPWFFNRWDSRQGAWFCIFLSVFTYIGDGFGAFRPDEYLSWQPIIDFAPALMLGLFLIYFAKKKLKLSVSGEEDLA